MRGVKMHIVTWNAQGGGNNKQELLKKWHDDKDIDVVCIQEAGTLELEKAGWEVHKMSVAGAFNQRCVTAILYRNKKGEPITDVNCNSSTGRSICGIIIKSTRVSILSFHAESSDGASQDFLSSIGRILARIPDNFRIVIGGDFNNSRFSWSEESMPYRENSNINARRNPPRSARNDSYEVWTQYWRTHQNGQVLDYFMTKGNFHKPSVFIPWREWYWGSCGCLAKKYSDHNPVHFTFT